MQMKSELIQLQIQDSFGEAARYFTYDGYFDEEDRKKLRRYRRNVQKNTFSFGAFNGLLSYYFLRSSRFLDRHPNRNKLISNVTASGFVGLASYLIFDHFGTQSIANYEKTIAVNSEHLPLWKSKLNAVNPDRAFFELIDSNNNEPSIFHSGLTPQAAQALLPNKTIGKIPAKPKKSSNNTDSANSH